MLRGEKCVSVLVGDKRKEERGGSSLVADVGLAVRVAATEALNVYTLAGFRRGRILLKAASFPSVADQRLTSSRSTVLCCATKIAC
jgi:hypothetical protein